MVSSNEIIMENLLFKLLLYVIPIQKVLVS